MGSTWSLWGSLSEARAVPKFGKRRKRGAESGRVSSEGGFWRICGDSGEDFGWICAAKGCPRPERRNSEKPRFLLRKVDVFEVAGLCENRKKARKNGFAKREAPGRAKRARGGGFRRPWPPLGAAFGPPGTSKGAPFGCPAWGRRRGGALGATGGAFGALRGRGVAESGRNARSRSKP